LAAAISEDTLVDFRLIEVDNSVLYAASVFPLAGKAALGSIVGKAVKLANKIVGSVIGVGTDPAGVDTVRVALDSPEAAHLCQSGCVSAVRVDAGEISLRDRTEDHDSAFSLRRADGSVLQKRFIGLSEFEQDKFYESHLRKLPRGLLNKNADLFIGPAGMPFLSSDVRRTISLFRNPRRNPNL
jgi:hypothetical protein